MNYGEEKCVLCGKTYKSRSKKSWFCLDCYINDYLPNKNKYGLDDFVSGIYSFITKRHVDNFYKPIEQIEEDCRNKIMTPDDVEMQNALGHFFEIKVVNASSTPEQARDRMVKSYCDKITYVS